ncbi:hypothetical protein GCM10010495_13140 [Kitasatospora herbaricolor]|uniref:hypothetical protein n=1 Tax=Kitasatospora herbaricolor TaxID=68217 RepID=UPI00174E4405|nr:hypothetical protein [Kitasatospora herbaricolor]MDQ0309124.1 hypothetical protein [Kitasatospora herbaricolor]GGV03192.1 hypothetical protein GCM10010495_13140 [Kitasatospora herbaricolor]
MPITDEIKKTLNDPTPLYALAGAGDLAYEKLREVPGKVEALAADRKGTQERATARLQEAQARLVEAQAKVTESVNTLPTDLKVLQEKAQTFALQQVGRAVELAVKAKETYDELAVRGKGVVEKGRGEESGALSGTTLPAQAEAEPVEAEIVEDEDDAPVAADASGEDDAADGGAPAEKKAPRARRTSTQK